MYNHIYVQCIFIWFLIISFNRPILYIVSILQSNKSLDLLSCRPVSSDTFLSSIFRQWTIMIWSYQSRFCIVTKTPAASGVQAGGSMYRMIFVMQLQVILISKSQRKWNFWWAILCDLVVVPYRLCCCFISPVLWSRAILWRGEITTNINYILYKLSLTQQDSNLSDIEQF